ncbi:hypothetical protein AA0488_1864 [Kozakia baliensis NRIC 0488]|uniref:Uncharacterized protein n=1 Tax=Kozakia baliensis TaxID=153496 RepID=A0A1D8UUK0_9PROT|nr:hypothetical protein A0U89_09320 [Kozakia baliensis]GBR29991.1 hypothetical protein AA0488_1864 [Kozakia baliensis NRIC 0488]GEL63269.1 ATP-binding protein [Kozakia baliensis]
MRLAAFLLGAASSVAAAEAAPLIPHVAHYDLSLVQIRSGNAVGASGDVSYHVEDMCDAWSMQQHLALHVTDREGEDSDTVSDYATLESKDGQRLIFTTTQNVDGTMQSHVEGQADRLRDGRILVHFRAPEDKSLTLPRGTLFPLEHTQAILSAARQGKRQVAPLLFDGTSDDGAFYTFVTIRNWAQYNEGAFRASLAHVPAAQVHVAFFSMKPDSITPDFELSARYFDNGLSDKLRMDFGDFVMDGAMRDLTLLPAAHCPH